MEISIESIVSNISIASDPRQSRPTQNQAVQYLNYVRENVVQSWPVALQIFLETRADGSRAYDSQSRLFALQIVEDLLDNRCEQLKAEDFSAFEQAFMNYIQSEYAYGSAEATAPFIRNKFSHTLALLFVCTYPDQWPNFFSTIFTLLRTQSNPSSSQSSSSLNPHISQLFLYFLIEISGEVADSVLKSARTFSEARRVRDSRVRDAVRLRDATKVVEAVLTIIIDGEGRLASIRREADPPQSSVESLENLVALGMRAFAGVVPWIDINLSVTPHTLPVLFRLLSDPSIGIRLATSTVFLRIVQKGLQSPHDKIQLIRVLSLGEVLQSLEEKSRDVNRELDYNGVSYRESLGRLADALGLELIKLTEEGSLSANAEQLLEQLLPTALNFMADEFDEISMTVFPFMQSLFASYKRAKKSSPNAHLTEQKRQFLSFLLQVVLQKMRYDPETHPDDLDEDELAEFDNMRKDLRTFLDAALVIDEDLVLGTVHSLVISTLSLYDSGSPVDWSDAELAVFLVFLFGELQRSKGVSGRQAFLQLPPNFGTMDKDQKRQLDYNALPLNVHGEMLLALVQSNMPKYPHSIVTMQFFEAVARYGEFFKVRKDCVQPVLELFIGEKGIHNTTTKLRGRIFYLFHRFIKDTKDTKSDIIYANIALTLIERIRPVLDIQVELPTPESPEDDILEEAVETPGLFDNQLYLFETVGTLTSLVPSTAADQASVLLAVVSDLLSSLSRWLQTPMVGPQDVLPVLQAHHLIRALGSVAKGFPDAPIPTPQDYAMQPWIPVFNQVAEAILVSLEVMNKFKVIREACRFAFARLIATGGAATTQNIPRLMTSLLTHFDTTELAEFIAFLGLVIHKLQFEVFSVVNELITPLHEHIVSFLALPIDGTDAKQTHAQIKKAYLDLLMAMTNGRLAPVLITEVNKSHFEALVGSIINVAADTSDPVCQRVAFALLGRFVTNYGGSISDTEPRTNGANGRTLVMPVVSGFDSVIYDRLVPLAFDITEAPDFNISDGQTFAALGEIGLMLKAIQKVRGDEFSSFLAERFLPAKNWPPDLTQTFVFALRENDNKVFKKSWQEFTRSIRPRPTSV